MVLVATVSRWLVLFMLVFSPSLPAVPDMVHTESCGGGGCVLRGCPREGVFRLSKKTA